MTDPIVPTPKNLSVQRNGPNLVIVRKWWHYKYIFFAFFCLAWDSFLVFWYSMAFSSPSVPWLMVVFPVLHVAVGIYLTYMTIAGFVNKTIVVVGQGSLSITHDPLPWPGNKSYSSYDIKQLYVKEKKSHNNNGTSVTYQLRMVTQDNKDVKLIGLIDNEQSAIFMEHTLEKELRIEDQPVAGESKTR